MQLDFSAPSCVEASGSQRQRRARDTGSRGSARTREAWKESGKEPTSQASRHGCCCVVTRYDWPAGYGPGGLQRARRSLLNMTERGWPVQYKHGAVSGCCSAFSTPPRCLGACALPHDALQVVGAGRWRPTSDDPRSARGPAASLVVSTVGVLQSPSSSSTPPPNTAFVQHRRHHRRISHTRSSQQRRLPLVVLPHPSPRLPSTETQPPSSPR